MLLLYKHFLERIHSFFVFFIISSILFFSCNNTKKLFVNNPEKYIHGYVAPGFEEVKKVFLENFISRGEKGAAITVYYKDTIVVNLFGGFKNKKLEPWNENTLVLLFSASKGVTAITTAMAISNGLFGYNDKIGKYWHSFACNGKEDITVSQMLCHQAGIPLFDKKLKIKQVNDTAFILKTLEKQKPIWQPGTQQGYHLYSTGLYMNELIKHSDTKHRELRQYFYDEIAKPLNIEFYFGLPDSIDNNRLAKIINTISFRGLFKFWQLPPPLRRKLYNPFSLINKIFRQLIGLNPNDINLLKTDIPSINGIGKVRDVAKLYWVFAKGASELNFKPQVFNEIIAPPLIMPDNNKDFVLGEPMYYRCGFRKPSDYFPFGSSEKAFGMTGAGGSFAFADPDLKLGYCYAMTKMNGFAQDDPREKALRKAVYACIAKLDK